LRVDIHKGYIRIGALIILLGIVAGAFGAHFIENKFGENASQIFETASRYQIYHGFGIIILGLLWNHGNQKYLGWASRLFIVGTICFSGSLYLLSLKPIIGSLTKIIGPITPIGGLLFIIGWVLVFLSLSHKNN
jgi:uncharacterized membrane protein YgdD (TMEM256/DUF423 family)